MIIGTHAIVYADDADRARQFLRDVLGLWNVDAGTGGQGRGVRRRHQRPGLRPDGHAADPRVAPRRRARWGGEVVAADEQRTDELPDRERRGHRGDEVGPPRSGPTSCPHRGEGGDHEGATHGHRRHHDCRHARPRDRRQHPGGHDRVGERPDPQRAIPVQQRGRGQGGHGGRDTEGRQTQPKTAGSGTRSRAAAGTPRTLGTQARPRQPPAPTRASGDLPCGVREVDEVVEHVSGRRHGGDLGPDRDGSSRVGGVVEN